MNFKDVFIDSLSYPFTDLKRFIVLLLLFLGSFLLIPALIGYGYLLKIIDHTMKGKSGLPDYDKAGDLIVPGIKYYVINLIYGIPSLIIAFLLLNRLDLTALSTTLTLTNPINMILLMIVGFLVSIVFIIGLANMVYEKRFMAAFDFKKIFQLINKIGWKKYLAYVLVYSLIVNIISLFTLTLLVPTINPGSLGNIFYYLIFTAINIILSSYSRIFGSRFKGLIYPLEMKEGE